MVTDNEAINDVIINYVKDVKSSMTIEKAFLFGSYAKGDAHEHSDIDLCFFSSSFEGQEPPDVVMQLYRLSRKYKGFDIQPRIFTMADLNNDNPFVKEILRTGVELHVA